MTATLNPNDVHDEPTRVRVLLISPARRLLLMKYRNPGPTGIERPCWVTAGGGRKASETIEQCARREIAEETGFTDVVLGPVVWYGEDNHRSRHWNAVFREHFILPSRRTRLFPAKAGPSTSVIRCSTRDGGHSTICMALPKLSILLDLQTISSLCSAAAIPMRSSSCHPCEGAGVLRRCLARRLSSYDSASGTGRSGRLSPVDGAEDL